MCRYGAAVGISSGSDTEYVIVLNNGTLSVETPTNSCGVNTFVILKWEILCVIIWISHNKKLIKYLVLNHLKVHVKLYVSRIRKHYNPQNCDTNTNAILNKIKKNYGHLSSIYPI